MLRKLKKISLQLILQRTISLLFLEILVLLPVTANNNSGPSVLRLQKAISVLKMRAELRLQNKAGMLLTPQVGYERE